MQHTLQTGKGAFFLENEAENFPQMCADPGITRHHPFFHRIPAMLHGKLEFAAGIHSQTGDQSRADFDQGTAGFAAGFQTGGGTD